jgi:hypothetical protein
MINENLSVTEKEYMIHRRYRICWSAIFSGALVGVGLGFLLYLYSAAISLSAFSSSAHGASVIAIGGLLGMLIGVIASMATAGFVAGYLGRYHYYHIHGGVIYGFITWSLALLMSILIAGPMMHYVSSYENALTHRVNMETPKVMVNDDATANDAKSTIFTHKNKTNSTVAELTPTELAGSGWIVFVLFFVGALSSCIGACFGMQCKRAEP